MIEDEDKPARAIVTNYRLYRLSDDQQGQPVEDALRGVRLPDFLKGAKVYEVDGRRVIARPDDEAIARAVSAGVLIEVKDDD